MKIGQIAELFASKVNRARGQAARRKDQMTH